MKTDLVQSHFVVTDGRCSLNMAEAIIGIVKLLADAGVKFADIKAVQVSEPIPLPELPKHKICEIYFQTTRQIFEMPDPPAEGENT